MKNENIGTNITNETIYSTNVHEEENVSSEVLTDNQIDATMSASDIQSGEAELVLMQPLDETADVATASVECCDDCCEDKASTAEMDNAVHLTLNEWRNDTITSSISERWYKFSTNEADTYTIYTSGSTDTIGRLYDENGDRVTLNDDRAGSLNFRIVYPLDANSAYYVKVTTPQAQTGEFSIRVVKRVLPALSKYNLTLNVGEEDSIQITTSSNSTTDIYVKYSSSNPDSVSVNSDTGDVTAVGTGISVITATDIIHNDVIGECEVWVRGKKPVILLHGRMDDTDSVWGAPSVASGLNNGYDCHDEAPLTSGTKRYTDVDAQRISDTCPEHHSEGGYLLHYLTSADEQGNNRGYIKNANLFAFNYPNEDAVVYSAKKLKLYIDNLIEYVRTSGSDTMKACFFRSRADCVNNNYNKIDIVAHSMGGLVARYYIENLGYDNRVDKLITVCTPHWGTGYAWSSSAMPDDWSILEQLENEHFLCDHDLNWNSSMYGESDSVDLVCSKNKCQNYVLTDELNYDMNSRNAKYYAIAAIDKPDDIIHRENDVCMLIPTTIDSYHSLGFFLAKNGIINLLDDALDFGIFDREDIDVDLEDIIDINDIKDMGDNVVGFLSQIGWTGDNNLDLKDIFFPRKTIKMEKIILDVDTDGGNGLAIPVLDLADYNWLHVKIPHRTEIMRKIYYILDEKESLL